MSGYHGNQEEASEGSKGSTADDWLPSPLPDGYLHLLLPQQRNNITKNMSHPEQRIIDSRIVLFQKAEPL